MTIFNRSRTRLLALGAMAAVCLSLGCARDVPNQNGLSGRRIHVLMRFNSPPEPNFYYYFLINKYGPTGQLNDTHGPVPVLGLVSGTNNGLGNGFATSSVQDTTGTISGLPDYGITDFVLFHSPQPQQSIGLYHFTTNPNVQPTPPNYSQPLRFIGPADSTTGSATAAQEIQFDLDMSQLVTDVSTTTAKIAEGRATQYLQVNIVATNITPVDPTSNVNKEVDAMGDTSLVNGQNTFLQIDLSQSRTYTSRDNTSSLNEPTGDVYPTGSNGNSALDLVYWEIDVQP